MNRFTIAAMLVAGCSQKTNDGDPGDSVGITVGMDSGSATAGDDGVDDGVDDGSGSASADDDVGDDAVEPPKFDVGAGGAVFCQYKEAGLYCDGTIAVTCGDMGDIIQTVACVPDVCLESVGCVPCLTGQYDCQGPNVVTCNDAVNPPVWQQVEMCDPAAGQMCDLGMGTCTPIAPLGGTEPTGVYFQYADFSSSGGVFQSGYDVDGLGNRLFVSASNHIDVYEVELLDSDGDGQLEPNQHPDNLDDPGPIEERVLTYIEELPVSVNIQLSTSEIEAFEDRIYVTTSAIDEYLLPGMVHSIAMVKPPWTGNLSQLGYDAINELWYASNESSRRVFQYDANTALWGIMFEYPPLAGDHMDGLEVVPDPTTGTPYVYVSDMTSDFIGQYRKDPVVGWVQENLFEYTGTAGAAVEGMGYGPLNHFWATSGSSVYELGGGDLTDFLDPEG